MTKSTNPHYNDAETFCPLAKAPSVQLDLFITDLVTTIIDNARFDKNYNDIALSLPVPPQLYDWAYELCRAARKKNMQITLPVAFNMLSVSIAFNSKHTKKLLIEEMVKWCNNERF